MPSQEKNQRGRTKAGGELRFGGNLARSGFPGSAALRAFESAGRLLSFKRAAQEVKLTESAISFQIRQLERDLGINLFERGHRQIKLTPAGRAYLAVVQQAHRDIADATVSLATQEKHPVRISLVSAMAQYWLIPLLGDLTAALPDVSLSVVMSNDLADLDRDEIDLAIRYGTGTWPRARTEPLMDEYLIPVAHPAVARKLATRSIAAATDIPLILNLQHPEEWSAWLPVRQQRLALETKRPLLRLESSGLVLRAAMEGLGIAIGRRPVVDKLLESGDLVALTKDERPSGKGYFLLTPLGRRGLRPEIAAVVAYLKERA